LGCEGLGFRAAIPCSSLRPFCWPASGGFSSETQALSAVRV